MVKADWFILLNPICFLLFFLCKGKIYCSKIVVKSCRLRINHLLCRLVIIVKLSILDQSPISTGQTAQEALMNSVALAQLGEKEGYNRFWIAEHHDLYGLACPNPDVMLSLIGSKTNTIRIGAGAVLLPYYKPFRVAETYNLLATLYPERVDLGLGRAPGGSAEVSLALSDNYLKQVNQYSASIDELSKFLHQTMPEGHPYAKIKASPVPEVPPKLWLLGTSGRSAELAAEKGLSYAFGHFMTDFNGEEIVANYRREFIEKHDEKPDVIIAIHAICAETTEKAHELAKSTLAWSLLQEKEQGDLRIPSLEEVDAYHWTAEDLDKMERRKNKMVIGNPEEVATQVRNLAEDYHADEIMIVTITHDIEDKFASYRLIAEAMDL